MRPDSLRPLARVAIATAFTLVLTAVPAAWASHYRLPAAGLVSEQETAALRIVGIDTTAALLEQAARRAGRRKLVRQTRISSVRLTLLATQCDLLRLKGVGPSMVRLLQAAGIRHTQALGRLEAAPALERMDAANKVHNITEVLPDVTMVAGWIAQARTLTPVLEGIR